MSKLVSNVVDRLAKVKDTSNICDQTYEIGTILKDSITILEDVDLDDEIYNTGTIDFEMNLAWLYYEAWQHQTRYEHDDNTELNKCTDSVIEAMTKLYLN